MRPSGIAGYGLTHGAHGQPLGFRIALPSSSALRGSGGGTTLPGGEVGLPGGGNAATPSWTAGTSLDTARSAHRSVVLTNGKILVSGGVANSTLLATSEIYDPAAGTTTPTAEPMGGARASHTATFLEGNGKVLVTGGWDSSNGTRDSCELYDPSNQTWTPAASMNHSRAEHEAVVLQDGRVLVIGGAVNGASLPTAEIYNPATDSWSDAAPLNRSRGYFTASLLPNGTVLVVGGWSNSGDVSKSAEIFDPLAGPAGTWTPTADLTEGRDSHAAVVDPADGSVLVAGGELYAPLASAERYTVATRTAGSWSGAGTMPTAHVYLTLSVLSSGKVMASGGYTGDGTTISSSADIFSGAGWSAVPSMTSPRAFMSAHTLATGQVVVIGGYSTPGTSTPTTDIFTNGI